jgi:hypothetical protein
MIMRVCLITADCLITAEGEGRYGRELSIMMGVREDTRAGRRFGYP